jgi:hypothetical protein
MSFVIESGRLAPNSVWRHLWNSSTAICRPSRVSVTKKNCDHPRWMITLSTATTKAISQPCNIGNMRGSSLVAAISRRYRTPVIEMQIISRPFSSTKSSNAPNAIPSTGKSLWISATTIAIVFGSALAARSWYSSTIDSDYGMLNSITGSPRQDQSKVTIVLPKPSSTVVVVSNKETKTDGTTSSPSLLLQVDRDELMAFLETQKLNIQVQKENAKQQTQLTLHNHLTDALQSCQTRGIKQFASWYFSYTTSYRLLSIAMNSAAKHALKMGHNEHQTIQQAVTHDLQLYICDKYLAIVLRPALTDPKVHRALVTTLEDLYRQVYQPNLMQLEMAMQQYAANGQEKNVVDEDQTFNSESSSTPFSVPPGSITLQLDWKAQVQKAQHLPIVYERNPPEFSVALIGGSAIAGKSMGGAAVKAVSAKLAAPFATKAVATTLGSKAAAGATGGIMAGGPWGGAMGAAIGICMDMAVNKGVSLMQRSAFERDVRESLDATILEWEQRMLPEVGHVVQEEWFGQLESMLQINGEQNKKNDGTQD